MLLAAGGVATVDGLEARLVIAAGAGQAVSGTPRVLVVDDEPSVRELIGAVLETVCAVTEAGDGPEAFAALDGGAVDLVVLDLMMPHVDGLAVLRRIKGDPTTAATPVVVLTGLGRGGLHDAARAAGADAYLSKPFSPADLRRAVVERLGR